MIAHRKQNPYQFIDFNSAIDKVEYILVHNLTLCLLRNGDDEEAEEQIEEVEKVLNSFAKRRRETLRTHVRLLRAELFFLRGKWDRALAELDGIREGDAMVTYPLRVKIHVARREYRRAKIYEKRAVESLQANGPLLRPPYWKFALVRAELAFGMNEFDRAVSHLGTALDLRIRFDLPCFSAYASWLKPWPTRLRNEERDALAERVDAEIIWAKMANEEGIMVLDGYHVQLVPAVCTM